MTTSQTIPPAYKGIVASMLRSRLEHPELYSRLQAQRGETDKPVNFKGQNKETKQAVK